MVNENYSEAKHLVLERIPDFENQLKLILKDEFKTLI
jgi:hypothetical protein